MKMKLERETGNREWEKGKVKRRNVNECGQKSVRENLVRAIHVLQHGSAVATNVYSSTIQRDHPFL